MKLKLMVKRTVALMAAMCCLLFNLTAYGAEIEISTVYSGRLTYGFSCWFEISETDAVLNKVIYPISFNSNKLVSTEGPDKLIFDASQFAITYDHQGRITDLDGNFISMTPEKVKIETRKVSLKYTIFGGVKAATVVFNGCDYNS